MDFLLSPLLLRAPATIFFFFSEFDSVSKLTREFKIRVVWFVLKMLLTHFKMLIVPHFTLRACSVSHCE